MLERFRQAWARVSLRTRLLLLLLGGLLSVQGASLWWALSDRAATTRRATLVHQVQRAVDVVVVMDAVPAEDRAAVAAAVRYPILRLVAAPSGDAAAPEVVAVVREEWSRRLPGRAVAVVASRGPLQRAREPGRAEGLRIMMATRLRDGQALQAEVEVGAPRFRTEGLLGPLVLLGVVTALLVMLAMRWALRPLEQLAAGAKALGVGLDAQPVPQQGPPEVRQAAEALNSLHARLREHVQGRVQSLAAISHDLRTPITRLRLRAELLPDAENRATFGRDLRQLEDMVQATLDYLRGIGEMPALEPVDVDGLLAQVIEDVEGLGGIEVDAPEPCGLVVRGHAPSLRRALVNLLRNAAVHASEPVLSVEPNGAQVRIHILDRGPGIPEQEIPRVMRPFEQLDRSRAASSGAGLGLAIAHEVAVRHGGRLVVANREGGGLRATLELAAA